MKAVWFIGGLVLAGVIIGWLANGRGRHPVTDASPRVSRQSAPVVWSPPRQMGPHGVYGIDTNAIDVGDSTAMGGAESTSGATNWQNQIAEMLVSDLDEAEKGRQLLQLFPSLPEAGQVQLAEQLSFILNDDDYAQLGQYLSDDSLPGPVLDALLSGLLLRSNETQAPLLLAVAQDDQNPRTSQARQLLETLLGEPLPSDRSVWSAQVQRWLEANREPAPQPPQ